MKLLINLRLFIKKYEKILWIVDLGWMITFKKKFDFYATDGELVKSTFYTCKDSMQVFCYNKLKRKKL